MPYGEQINNNSGATKPTSIEGNEHEREVFAKRVIQTPTNYQILCDYDVRTDGQPVYVGFAPKGAAQDDFAWLIYKLTYDGNNNVTSKKTAYDKYSNRATTASYS